MRHSLLLVMGLLLTASMAVSACGKKEEAPAGQAAVEKAADKAPAPAPPGTQDRFKVPFPSASPVKGGDASALVTIIEFSEFQCPFCTRVNPTIRQLLQDYGSKLRVAFRHNPMFFHKNAEPASLAAIAVQRSKGDEGFWKMHDLLFEKQQEWSKLQGEELIAKLSSYAGEAGADADAVAALIKTPSDDMKAQIEADRKDAAAFGARGTPSFFINGKLLAGAQPIERFKSVIDEEMKNAQKFSGARDVYAEVVKDAKLKAEPPDQPNRPVEDDTTVYKIEIPPSAPVTGAKNPKVTIIEFSEFQCPFCTRILPTMQQIKQTYGDDVAIYFGFNPLSFHKNAKTASFAAMAAGEQGKFWEMHDALFAAQKEWSQLTADQLTDKFVALAKQAGVPKIDRFSKDFAGKQGEYEEIIKKHQAIAMKFGATGTPTCFVNGRMVRGARAFDQFKKVIDEEIRKADALMAKGVKPANLYAELTKDGKETYTRPTSASPAQEDTTVYTFSNADLAGSPFKGGKNAKVTIIQFSEFQCPFCSRVEPTVDKILKEYGDKVKLVWKNMPLPFHKNARMASVAFLAAEEQNKGWKMHEKLFATQKEWSMLAEDELKSKFASYGKEIGLNETKFVQAMNNAASYDAIIDRDQELGKRVGARGTPTFFINGKKLVGAQPFEGFKSIIDAAIESK